MYNAKVNLLPGFTAAADYSADGTNTGFGLYQYRFVYLSAAGVVTVCDTEGQRPIGVLMNRPKQYEVADVAELTGSLQVQSSTNVGAGVPIETADDGQAATVAYGASGSDHFICGYSITASTATPGLITIAACTPHRNA